VEDKIRVDGGYQVIINDEEAMGVGWLNFKEE
jgi:hypothetical protein